MPQQCQICSAPSAAGAAQQALPFAPAQHKLQHGNRPTASHSIPQHDCKPLCSPSMFATSAHAAAKVSDLFPLACALLCFMQHQDIMAIACCIPACVAIEALHF